MHSCVPDLSMSHSSECVETDLNRLQPAGSTTLHLSDKEVHLHSPNPWSCTYSFIHQPRGQIPFGNAREYDEGLVRQQVLTCDGAVDGLPTVSTVEDV